MYLIRPAHLMNAKVQLFSLAGLRTQGREPCGSALRGDFPAIASVMVPRSFPNTAARQFRSLTGFPIPWKCLQNKHYIWYMTKDTNTIYTKCHGNKALFRTAVVNDTGQGFIKGC
ncbi:hypothetical protein MARLIPOL_10281 [Marinobacter lipolyticus SM19]|uniref:Uncharacterized protein n=1 Tax=Marinobacter lipolyticus SM19 TaxID=1318628 RepID=R8B087_9GAMM|nr:hypothetical protein MARLIPOL_10281 [Marinobacter lipolyticus SM19]